MDRRRFTFWLGLGLFSLSEKLGVRGLDSLAAAAMRHTEAAKARAKRTGAEHWTVGGNKKWRWLERENLINGEWVLTGTTTPINKETGERKTENIGYIDDSLVPRDMRGSEHAALDPVGHEAIDASGQDDLAAPIVDLDRQLPTAKRRARHGRPPSQWLRSLNADEIRIWLETINVPEAGVSGMTVWTHLTRDHSFDAEKIEGLSEEEQNKLHAAAHYGY
jgi:hypothetical protein